MGISSRFAFDNTFAQRLPSLGHPADASSFPSPSLVKLNTALAEELGLDVEQLEPEAAAIFSGNAFPDGAEPIAMGYAGHQFGGFSPQLGDGRAMLLGELVDTHGRRRDLHLKGSGATVYSRGGDGKASLGPMLREYVMGEALYGLNISTSRALAVVTTGEPVFRETPLPGAVVARVAASHIRVGTFEYLRTRDGGRGLEDLAYYTIMRHDPDLWEADEPRQAYAALLRSVGRAQAKLIASWMHVGFIHGVMNTDNVAISGETIDFGPCAFMDAYHPRTVFSSIDRGGRYAYGNQPGIGQWNQARFAEALLPLLADDQGAAIEVAQGVLEEFGDEYESAWLRGMRAKLGLRRADVADATLIESLLAVFEDQAVDYTCGMRALSSVLRGDEAPMHMRLRDVDPFETWSARWLARIDQEEASREVIADRMDGLNPIYIARNHKVEEALAAAVESEDLAPFERLIDVLSKPFEEREGFEEYAEPAPADFAKSFKTFCGT